jgi:hypothetical protein
MDESFLVFIDFDTLLEDLKYVLNYSFLIFNELCIHEDYITLHMKNIDENFNFKNSVFKYLYHPFFLDEFIKNSNIPEFKQGIDPYSFYQCCKKKYFFLGKLIYNFLDKSHYTGSDKHYFTLCFEETCRNGNFLMFKFLLAYEFKYCLKFEINSDLMENLYSNNIVPILADLNKDKIYFKEFTHPDFTNKKYQFIYFEKNRKSIFNDIPFCSICYDTKSTIITDCNHFYCTKCICEWFFTLKNSCPICRKEITINQCSTIISKNK